MLPYTFHTTIEVDLDKVGARSFLREVKQLSCNTYYDGTLGFPTYQRPLRVQSPYKFTSI